MSTVIKGSASGQINLNDTTGSIQLNGSDVLTFDSSGNVTAPNKLISTGHVLQVVHYLWQSQTSTTNTSYTDSGLTATITPSSTSSKILVIGSANGVNTQATATGVQVGLFNGATELTTPQFYAGYNTSSTDNQINIPFSYLHSPASTSAQTYLIKFFRKSGSGTVIIGANNSNSFITLMEIAG